MIAVAEIANFASPCSSYALLKDGTFFSRFRKRKLGSQEEAAKAKKSEKFNTCRSSQDMRGNDQLIRLIFLFSSRTIFCQWYQAFTPHS